jgi:hypothetical protein
MNTNKYIVLNNVINKEVLDFIKIQIKMHERVKCFNENKFPCEYPFGDKPCPTSFSEYGMQCCESMLLYLKPIIEKYIGKELLPTYSYLRIYYKGSILNKHVDRPSCEYSATICISTDTTPWDIYFSNGNENSCITLYPGDLIIYKGMELEHWREKYEGNEQIQVFLHYVDKNGKYSSYANDNRPIIGIDKK